MYSRAIPACKQFIILKQKIGWDKALKKILHDYQYKYDDFINWFNEYKLMLKTKAEKESLKKKQEKPKKRRMRRKG